mmetsp:Transcript_9583/g.39138  ORF Transcript_9583/g.39138 Transcript_9583/m.39138 type:complete len:200 (+) Transcript_9583:1618-2217(+)
MACALTILPVFDSDSRIARVRCSMFCSTSTSPGWNSFCMNSASQRELTRATTFMCSTSLRPMRRRSSWRVTAVYFCRALMPTAEVLTTVVAARSLTFVCEPELDLRTAGSFFFAARDVSLVFDLLMKPGPDLAFFGSSPAAVAAGAAAPPGPEAPGTFPALMSSACRSWMRESCSFSIEAVGLFATEGVGLLAIESLAS